MVGRERGIGRLPFASAISTLADCGFVLRDTLILLTRSPAVPLLVGIALGQVSVRTERVT
jgi:hypothetical protein